MIIRTVLPRALLLAGLGLAFTANAALAAGSYYVGTSISGNPVLWSYTPSTNLIKLCYVTTGNTLTCTPSVPVFAAKPGTTDNLQYRITQSSVPGGLWILDITADKEAMCGASLGASAYTINCALGAGIK